MANAQQHPRDLRGRQVQTGPGPQQISTTSTSAPEPTPSTPLTYLIINTPSQLSTCQSATVAWTYTGPVPADLTLGVTDINVDQSKAPSTPPGIIQIWSSSLDAASQSWTWPQVNVSSGYYIIEGAVLGSSAQSQPFFVASGSDTSCVPQSSSSISTPTTSSTTSSISSPSSPASSSDPATGSTKKTNVGAIAGGVIGGVIILAVGLAALLLLRKNKRASRSRRATNVGWGGLKSTDSQDPFSGGGQAPGHSSSGGNHGPTESMGGILNDSGPAAADNSQEDLYSIVDEKGSPTSPSVLGNADFVPPLPYNNRRASVTSSINNQATNYSRPRTSSVRNSNNSIPLADTQPPSRSRASVDIADYARSASLPGMSRPTVSPRKPEFSSAEMIPMGRSTSSNSALGARRASRKPVPQYDASELEGHSSSSNVELPSFDFESSQISGDSPVRPGGSDGPFGGLNHKSSFGDAKQMHYLIPDMPPPARS